MRIKLRCSFPKITKNVDRIPIQLRIICMYIRNSNAIRIFTNNRSLQYDYLIYNVLLDLHITIVYPLVKTSGWLHFEVIRIGVLHSPVAHRFLSSIFILANNCNTRYIISERHPRPCVLNLYCWFCLFDCNWNRFQHLKIDTTIVYRCILCNRLSNSFPTGFFCNISSCAYSWFLYYVEYIILFHLPRTTT